MKRSAVGSYAVVLGYEPEFLSRHCVLSSPGSRISSDDLRFPKVPACSFDEFSQYLPG